MNSGKKVKGKSKTNKLNLLVWEGCSHLVNRSLDLEFNECKSRVKCCQNKDGAISGFLKMFKGNLHCYNKWKLNCWK